MSMFKRCAMLLTVAAVFAAAVPAWGATVFSNYSDWSNSADAWNDTADPVEVVEDFVTVGAVGGQWDITTITINGYGGGIMGGAGPCNINIYADNNGSVGSLILALTEQQLAGFAAGADNGFAVSGLTLSAGETYWLGIEALGGSSNAVGWRRTGSNTTGITGTGYTRDGGGHIFSIEGQAVAVAVPLPAAAWAGMALMGVMGGWAGIKRKMRRD